ncbi:MAG: hypothetical protein JOY78_15600 [Pseudonocardia sp.]|nr:hypothetical protein [Pseudonocardia sp.]
MDYRFEGWIGGLGTAAGLRAVFGHWPRSPFGPFTDVMVELPGGHRVLLAPAQPIADFVAQTYRFDEVRIVPVTVSGTADEQSRWRVEAGPLALTADVGGRAALGRLLRAVPRSVATSPWWVAAIDAVARRVLPGVRTVGSAGRGRREFYAALDLRRIARATVTWEGADQGALAPVDPPVRFGFGSTPRRPSLARIVTLVRE